jgi:NAD(P)-dependent dehydrogenase (short-subunit alcohol dehydrogenase family)
VEKAAAKAFDTFGKVDILVNNAAFFNRKGVIDMTYTEWQKQLDVILGGTFLMTKYVGKGMIARRSGGAIVNIISTAGHQGEPGNIAYSTAKAGLLNFTQSAAMELAEHAIRVNSVTPTATDPQEQVERAARWGRQFTLPANIETVMAPFRKGIPMQKLPSPSHYGKAVAFLVSDDAEMITGVDLRVDGGAVAKYWAWTPPR